jgi:hypothetical protein
MANQLWRKKAAERSAGSLRRQTVNGPEEAVRVPGKSPGLTAFLNRALMLNVIAPLLIFYLGDLITGKLAGMVLAGGWCLGLVIVTLIRKRQANALAVLGAGISLIGLVGALLWRDPAVYMAAPICEDGLFALLFFGSLCFPRPLIQVIVEDSHWGAFPDELRRTAKYRAAWRILTAAWGTLNITQAVLRSILLLSVPIELYYGISKIYGQLSSMLLLAVSYWFPKWYWERSE